MGHPSPHRGPWPPQDFPHGCLFPKAHFFGLLPGLPIIGLQSPQELPGCNLKSASYMEGRERWKKEAPGW